MRHALEAPSTAATDGGDAQARGSLRVAAGNITRGAGNTTSAGFA